MINGAILDKGEDWYTCLKKIFQSLDNFQKDYNWLITDCEITTLNSVYTDRFHQEYTWISGEELTDIIMQDDSQWIWGVLSGFEKSYSKEEILNYELPYAEGYRGF